MKKMYKTTKKMLTLMLVGMMMFTLIRVNPVMLSAEEMPDEEITETVEETVEETEATVEEELEEITVEEATVENESEEETTEAEEDVVAETAEATETEEANEEENVVFSSKQNNGKKPAGPVYYNNPNVVTSIPAGADGPYYTTLKGNNKHITVPEIYHTGTDLYVRFHSDSESNVKDFVSITIGNTTFNGIPASQWRKIGKKSMELIIKVSDSNNALFNQLISDGLSIDWKTTAPGFDLKGGEIELDKNAISKRYIAEAGGSVTTIIEQQKNACNVSGWVGSVAKPAAGYEFAGWYDEKGTLVSESATLIPNDCQSGTYYAKFKVPAPEEPEEPVTPIVKKEITVTANSMEVTYNGLEQTVSGFKTLKVSVDGKTYEVSGLMASATGKDAGTYPTTITGTAVVKDDKGIDVTAEFDVKTENGSLVIKKAPLTIKTDSASKVFDGTPLTAGGSVEGLVGEEAVTFNTTGSQLKEGSSSNGYELIFNSTAKKSNYELKGVEIGTLTVTLSDALSVSAASYNGTYDAKSHEGSATASIEGAKVEYSINGTDWSASKPSVKDAGEVKYQVRASLENYKTAYAEGTLKVTPAPLTIKTDSASKTYDGTALTAGGSISGLVNSETVTFTITGSQKISGSSKNTYVLAFDKTADGKNYEVVAEEVGTLTVTDSEEKIVVTTTGGTFKYDGNAHKASVEVSTLPAGYKLDKAVSNDEATNVADGIIDANCDELVIVDVEGNDVTAKLNISYVDDKIEITPATLKIKTDSASKVFDGTPLTAGGSIEGLVGEETVTFRTIASQTAIGSKTNAYELLFDKTAIETNYIIEEDLGLLVVTAPAVTENPATPTPNPIVNPTPDPLPEIEDEPVVEPAEDVNEEPVEIIEPEVTPEVGNSSAWALVNLICVAASAIGSLALIISKSKKEEDEEEENEKRRKGGYKILAALATVASIVAFILTEDMTAPMVMVDKWTLLMVVLFIITLGSFFLGRKWHEEENEANAQ